MLEAKNGNPICFNMIIEERIKAVGLARFLPAMSKPVCLVPYLFPFYSLKRHEKHTCSKTLYFCPMLTPGVIPGPPVIPAAM